MTEEREVAGLRCFQVLEQLSAYLDGELAPAGRAQVDGHLSGCDVCAKFGDEVGSVVRRLKADLARAEPLSAETSARLREALDRELG